MKKIGFIDYYLDEGHALSLPKFIRESSFKGQFEVALAWEEIHPEGKKHIDDFCREQKVQKAASLDEVVAACDCLVVLSPDNAERHEDLADLALKSGKPVCVDKTFAPDLRSAQRMVDKARKHNTPLMSSSSLRFDSATQQAVNTVGPGPVHFVTCLGPGQYFNYAVHQLEPLVMLLGTGASRAMQCGNQKSPVMVIDYPDGRRGSITFIPHYRFDTTTHYGDAKGLTVTAAGDYFPRATEAMLEFFNTGRSPVPVDQTLEIMALIEAGQQAFSTPDQWVKVPGI